MSERHLIIGGNAAGMTAASRAKRLNPSLQVTILESGRYISYSICGLPFCLSGVVPRFEDLVLYTPESLRNQRGIEAKIETRAVEILPSRRSVIARNLRTGRQELIAYDKLLVATGYRPVSLRLEGVGASGVFTASRIEDGQAMAQWLGCNQRRQAVVIGGGFVGLEMAEALRRRGLKVTLVEKSSAIFSPFDPDMAALLVEELEANGVQVLTDCSPRRLCTRADGSVEAVELGGSGRLLAADVVFIDVGVEPQVELAASAGIRLGVSGGIAVSERMETSIPSIYAAGNCAETIHQVTGRPVVEALGTVAVKQGRVAGENMAGRVSHFRGTTGTMAIKVFKLSASRTGLSTEQATRQGFRAVEAKIESRFQAPYFEGEPGTVKVIADLASRRLLGAQIVGSEMAAVRIDVVASALASRMSVEEISQLDLVYTPPLGALWNPVLIAMNALLRKLGER